MKRFIYLLFFLIISHQLSAQTTLHGKVLDKDGKAIFTASVFLPELEKGMYTDLDGKFSFDQIGNGIVKLQCSMIGYLTSIQTVDMSRQTGDVIIYLEPTSLEMEEVVVFSNSTNLARNIPYTLSSISSEELQNSAQPTLMEKIAQQPGVDIISGGSGIGKPVIRGLSFNRIVFHSMGTRIENQQWDDDHDAGIAEAGLDRVEIVYGPSALIYGADALGGAVVFVDEKPAPAGKTMGSVNLNMFSNTHGINADAGIKSTSSSGLFYMARISDQSHTDYKQGKSLEDAESNQFASNSKFNNLSGKAKIGISRKWGVSKLSYSYLRSLTGMIVEPEEDSLAEASGEPFVHRSRSVQAPSQQVDIHVLSSENTFLAGTSKWNINAAYQSNNRKEFEPVPPGEPEYMAMGLRLHTYTYDAKWSSNEEKQMGITVGSQGMVQTNRNFGNNIAVPDADVNDYAAYGLAHYNVKRWNFLGGLRFDKRSINIMETTGVHEGEATLDSMEQAALDSSGLKRMNSSYEKHYYPFSFSLGAVFHPVHTLSLKANLATGFSAPNYAELSTFGKHEGTYRFEVGNPDLKAEQNVEFDLNVLWEQKNFALNVSGFYNHINDYIYLSPTANYIYDLQVIAYSQNNATIGGGAVGVTINPSTMKWLELNSTYSVTSGKLADGNNLPYIPANKIITELEFEKDSIGKLKNPFFSVLMRNYFAQNHPALYEAATGGYTLFDLHVGADFKIGRQTISIGLYCTNIFNIQYYNHLSIIKDIGIYEMGRNAGFKLRIPFGG